MSIGQYQGTPSLGSGGKLPIYGGTDWGLGAPTAANLGMPGIRYFAGGLHPSQFATHALTCTLGTVYGSRIFVPPGETLTQLCYALQAEIEDTPVTAQNGIAIYSAAGNLLWTSPDQAAYWGTTPFGVGVNLLPLANATSLVANTNLDIVVPSGLPYIDVAFLGNADTSGLVPWVYLHTASYPGTDGKAGTQTDGTATAWTGRTAATTFAATTGTQTGILSQIFCGVG